MSKFSGSKGRNLAILKEIVKRARVADIVLFTVCEWKSRKEEILARVQMLNSEKYIVRSSCLLEDQSSGSLAGAFSSFLSIPLEDVAEKIDLCIASYGRDFGDDEVLVQPMLAGVVLSGVAFSHDPSTCSEYRVISWHDSADTARVTSGKHANTLYEIPCSSFCCAPHLNPLRALMDELSNFYEGLPIDCEFAFTRNQEEETQIWLLQVRPLLLNKIPFPASSLSANLNYLKEKIDIRSGVHPYLLGSDAVYAVMPDWNPAEIIGIKPKQLALTLYRELITDSIWAYQRHNYGYRNLRSFPLMVGFFGMPYIDVRVSFNSFIPRDLPDVVAKKLVEFYIGKLLRRPHLHDKVEFEIVYSCYALDTSDRIKELLSSGFSQSEVDLIIGSLRALTNDLLNDSHSLVSQDASKLDELRGRLGTIQASSLDLTDKIYWLSEDCKRYGTLPFAGLARTGFIASQILNSIKSVGIFDDDEIQLFFRSLHTVGGRLARDKATLSAESFIKLYGHLRPGTYDIELLRYDENPELYFDWSKPSPPPSPAISFRPSLDQLKEIDTFLSSNGIKIRSLDLLDFIKRSIELREEAKFIFTKTLSAILSLIEELGRDFGMSRQDMAFLDFKIISQLYIGFQDPVPYMADSIAKGKKDYLLTSHLVLPPVITCSNDLFSFLSPDTRPSFITQKKFVGKVASSLRHCDIEGCIVFIENADPGYDWLFSHKIGALVTAWGGVNSHMAIRAGELQIPAVIGCGDASFNRWKSALLLCIDCAGSRVEIVE